MFTQSDIPYCLNFTNGLLEIIPEDFIFYGKRTQEAWTHLAKERCTSMAHIAGSVGDSQVASALMLSVDMETGRTIAVCNKPNISIMLCMHTCLPDAFVRELS